MSAISGYPWKICLLMLAIAACAPNHVQQCQQIGQATYTVMARVKGFMTIKLVTNPLVSAMLPELYGQLPEPGHLARL
ncbi:hypothetical protein [Candidatus Synechococcus calcipolaris]|uniref:hypothetical protein n=1 Tax=Candidatus Synechococcus calcipolaris TaxID=1522304 RepID=UPI0024115AF4|nr:hypothetical protein [Candidatus Synechococcus calcipolaris]